MVEAVLRSIMGRMRRNLGHKCALSRGAGLREIGYMILRNWNDDQK